MGINYGKSLKESRRTIIKGMNEIVLSLNNEGAYYNSWIYDVPDEATDEDLNEIADDIESFNHTVGHFLRIMDKYAKDGIFVGDTLITKDTI